mgnify:CR=1 FL=1
MVAIAAVLLVATWAYVLAALSGLVHGLPRRLRAPRRRSTARATNRADRAFARRHGVGK